MGTFDAENNYTPRQITERDIPSFAEAIEGTMVELKDGQLITGIVVKIDRDGVLLDVGYKTEGVIPTRELAIKNDVNPHDVVKIGESPGRPTLEPDGLVRIEQFALPAERGMDAAMRAVEAVLQPERDDVLQEPVPIGADEVGPSLLKIRGHGDDAGTRAGRVNARPPAPPRRAPQTARPRSNVG